jgi:hypothetical protein
LRVGLDVGHGSLLVAGHRCCKDRSKWVLERNKIVLEHRSNLMKQERQLDRSNRKLVLECRSLEQRRSNHTQRIQVLVN